jgi:hypothetical protein
MSNGFCVNYCLFISIGGMVLLVSDMQTYIGILCLANSEELKVEKKEEHGYTVLVAAAIYLFCFIVMIGIKCRKKQVVVPQGYQVLDDAS